MLNLKTCSTLDEASEMILLTLARAAENNRTLTAHDLAHELGTAPIFQALISQSLISVSANQITLTETGSARARALLRRHRLVERHFTDVLGLDWARAHEEADKFEHIVPPQVEQSLADQLGNPETCPHGNPIPQAHTDAERTSEISLAEGAPSTRAMITRIAIETPEALRHLATLGLLPNTEIEIENQAPFGGPVLVRVGRAHYALGRDLAARIWIKKIGSSEWRMADE